MRLHTLATVVVLLLSSLSFGGCYTDTVDAVSIFDVQLPVNFEFTFKNRQAPDTTTDHVDLNDYPVYRDNRETIRQAVPYSIAFWLESVDGDPSVETAEFPSIEFLIVFDGDTPADAIPLATFENVKASDYYKTPHILPIDEPTGKLLATALKTNPSFRVIQRYSRPTTGTGFYREIKARVDVAVRLSVEI
jgi:hypothetical protein